MEAFHKTICLRMVGRRHRMLDAPCLGELLEQGRAKLRTSVRGYGGRDSKLLNPAMGEGIEDGFGCDVCQWNGDGPTGKPVHGRKQITEAIGERKCDQVHVNMFKTTVWNNEIANGWNRVFDDLGSLAVEALACPLTDVLAYGRPDEFVAYGLASSCDTWVSKSMD